MASKREKSSVLAVALDMIFLLAIVVADSTDHPTVQTSKATIVGRRINIRPYQLPDFRKTVLAYTRLPYAEPPVGPLRFSLPVPMSLAGRVDGTRQSVACPQLQSLFFQVDLEQSEDCLYLDIFSPDPKPTSAPVMVWIHGGGYHFGSGSLPESIPTVLSAFGEVIVVTINYRLGPLGFLTTGDDTIPANLGLWDQRQALVWVQTYIQAFGGDPTQVTIFGESAGSASVNMHLISAMSAGLFSRAIMQSGALNTVWTHHLDKKEAVDAAFEFGKEMGCSTARSEDLLQCLRKTSLENFFAAYKGTFPLFSKYFFRPVADDHFLPGDPLQLTREGKFNPASVIIGCLESEGSLHLIPGITGIQGTGRPFVNSSLFPRIMMSQTGIQDSLLLDMIASVFMSDEELQSQEPDYAPAIIRYIGDSFHKCPTITLSNRLSETGRDVYAFVMDHVPSHSRWGKNLTWLGATHMEDIPYVFGSSLRLDVKPDANEDYHMIGRFNDGEVALSLQIMRYWTNFAKSGDPNKPSKGFGSSHFPVWRPYTSSEPNVKKLSESFQNQRGYQEARECYFIDKIQPALMDSSAELARLKAVLSERVSADSGKQCSDDEACP